MVNKELFVDPDFKRPIDQEMVDAYITILARAIARILAIYTNTIIQDFGNRKAILKARIKVAEELGNIRERLAKDFGRKAKINNIIFQLTEEIHRLEESFASDLTHDKFETKQAALTTFKGVVSNIGALFDDTFQTKEKKRILDESGIASAA
jgi:hypothetical protein